MRFVAIITVALGIAFLIQAGRVMSAWKSAPVEKPVVNDHGLETVDYDGHLFIKTKPVPHTHQSPMILHHPDCSCHTKP